MIRGISGFGFSLLALSLISPLVSKPVEDFGAIADGKTDNRKVLQAAIDHLAEQGGGLLVFTNGTYLTGSLELKSGLHLRILPGTILKAAEDPESIRYFQSSVISRLDVVPWKAWLFADSQANIRIDGGGLLDASGDAAVFRDGVENSPFRHYGLFMVNCENTTVEDLSMRSSAFWMQRFLQCKGIQLSGLSIYNHANKNNDGIDIDSSQDVIISNCLVDSSDDAIVIKSNGEQPSRNIVITNCILATHASALKTGTGSVGGFENITVSNIVIRRSSSPEMLHPLKVWQGLTGIDLITTDGGPMRNITISNVIMEGVQNPIHVRLGNRLSGNVARQGYGGDGDSLQGVQASDKATELRKEIVMEGITLSQITARNTGPWPIVIAGHEGHPVKDITLRDILLYQAVPGTRKDLDQDPNWQASGYPGRGMYGTALPAYGLVTNYTEGLVVENVRATPAPGDPRPAELHLHRHE